MHHFEIKQNFKFLKQERGFFIKYKNKNIQLTNKNNPNEFISLSTILNEDGKGGVAFIRAVLSVTGAKSKYHQNSVKH